jgi:hypothetical protein
MKEAPTITKRINNTTIKAKLFPPPCPVPIENPPFDILLYYMRKVVTKFGQIPNSGELLEKEVFVYVSEHINDI